MYIRRFVNILIVIAHNRQPKSIAIGNEEISHSMLEYNIIAGKNEMNFYILMWKDVHNIFLRKMEVAL